MADKNDVKILKEIKIMRHIMYDMYTTLAEFLREEVVDESCYEDAVDDEMVDEK